MTWASSQRQRANEWVSSGDMQDGGVKMMLSGSGVSGAKKAVKRCSS